MNETAFKPG